MNIYAVIWSAAASIGMALSLLLIVERWADLRAMGKIANGRRSRAVWRMAAEFILFLIHAGFLGIGIQQLDQPSGELSLTSVVRIGAIVGLIAISLIALRIQRMDPSPASVAEVVARDLRKEAEFVAERLLAVAEIAELRLKVSAEQSTTRITDAAERTAENTARIADNTAPPEDEA